jgi:probable rRNA maturation factor
MTRASPRAARGAERHAKRHAAPRTQRHAERHAVHVTGEGVRAAVSATRLADLVRFVLKAERIPSAVVSLTLVTAPHMARLNRRHLGHRGATDVITFALGDDGAGRMVADLYVCPAVARTQARAWRVGVREELARLVVHGTLHACGWDHPVDIAREASPMWVRQETLLARWLAAA